MKDETNDLRVTQLAPPQKNYKHQPVDPGIDPHPDFGGLRVRVVRPAPETSESVSEKLAP